MLHNCSHTRQLLHKDYATRQLGDCMFVKSISCLPREARPSSGMVVRPRAFSWSGMAGKALGSSP